MNTEVFIIVGVLSFFLGAIVSLLLRRAAYVLSICGTIFFGLVGISFVSGKAFIFSLPISSYLEFSFSGGTLVGFFLIVVSALCLPVSLYSIGYSRGIKNSGLLGFLYNLFILSIYSVVLSANIVTFLIAWETMSVISYFLVTFERDAKSAKAGLIYAIMTHIGTAFIILLFFLLFRHTGRVDFVGMKNAVASMPTTVKGIIFIFSLIGFGTKAGIIPLHTWLPRAHPAAPTNISAVMSGVMIKTGVFGFVKIVIEILSGTGAPPEWWGITVIVIGAVSSVLGVLYALMEHDIKRLLAYHSVENIGIIFLGIGAYLIFESAGLHNLSAIALIAALFHVLNHAVFKGLLFLASGSVLHATHTKNLEDMGGLLKLMPYTGLFFLIGSVSICALPPFNGFVSEWLTLQSLLLGFKSQSVASKIISPLGGAALALTGALAAACFVKAFGVAFLGLPRSPEAAGARESSPSMIVAMAALAVLCLLLGVFPGSVISLMSPFVTSVSAPYGFGDSLITERGFLYLSDNSTAISPAVMLIMLLVMASAVWAFVMLAGGKVKTSYRAAWDCGIPALTPRMQYTATAFSKPLKIIFKRIYLPRRELRVSYIVKPFFVKAISYSGEITPFFEKYFYEPLTGFVRAFARRMTLLQSGSLHLYLGYMLITLIVLLVFAG